MSKNDTDSMLQWMNINTPLLTPIWNTTLSEEIEFPLLNLGSPRLEPSRKRERIEKLPQLGCQFSPAITPRIHPTESAVMTPLALLDMFSQQHINALSVDTQPFIQPENRTPAVPYMQSTLATMHPVVPMMIMAAQNSTTSNGLIGSLYPSLHPLSRSMSDEGIKRSSHKFAEQKRRDGLKDLIAELRIEVGGVSRMEVLSQALEFIRKAKASTNL